MLQEERESMPLQNLEEMCNFSNSTIAQDVTLYSRVVYVTPRSFLCPSYSNKIDGDMDVT